MSSRRKQQRRSQVTIGFRHRRTHIFDERERSAITALRVRRIAASQKRALGARSGNERERREMYMTVNIFDRLECVVEIVEQEGQTDARAESRNATMINFARGGPMGSRGWRAAITGVTFCDLSPEVTCSSFCL